MSDFSEAKKFIEENMEIYTREALTRELLKRGYSETDIEEAWKYVLAVKQPTPSFELTTPIQKGKFWLAFLVYFLMIPLIIGILARIVREQTYYIIPNNSFQVFLIGGIITVLSGIILSSVFWESDKPLSRGIFFGCLFTTLTPLVSLGIIIGICSAG